jgi:hypothetical protein
VNYVLEMIEYNMPYDFILPYEGIGLIQNYKYFNRHVPVYAIEQAEGFQLNTRSRRHKSEIPEF